MRQNMHKNLIAVSDGDERAGTATWWRLEGHVLIEKLYEEWAKAGLDGRFLPKKTTPSQALKRALSSFTGKDHSLGGKTLLRPLGRSNWALVHELVDEEARDLDYSKKLVAGIDDVGTPRFHPEDHAYVPLIKDAYEDALATYDHTAMSQWLCKLVVRADSIPLRDGGGIYFIPPTATKFWSRVGDVINDCSRCYVYTMPVMRTADAMKAAMDGLLSDTEKQLHAISQELVEDMSVRSLASRRNRCDTLLDRLEAYEGLLGDGLKTVTERIDSVRASISESIFAHAAKLREINAPA